MEKSGIKNSEMSCRFREIRAYFFANNNALFSQRTGVDSRSLSSICNGKRKAGNEIMEKVFAACNGISRSWLWFGEGDMIVGEKNHTNGEQLLVPCGTTIEGNSGPVAANGSTIQSSGLSDKERELYERMIKNLEERIEQQAAYIRILSDEHRGLVHEVINITTDNNTKISAVQQSAVNLMEDIEEIKSIGFRLENLNKNKV